MVFEPANAKNNTRLAVFACLALAVLLVTQSGFIFQPEEIAEAEMAEAVPVETESEEITVSTEAVPVEELEEEGEAEEDVQLPGDKPKYRSLGTYQVQKGDSLYWIAGSYGISVEELRELNDLESDVLAVGQRLVVPHDFKKLYPTGVRLSNMEVEWLAQMIYAEARGEPYLGQVAVGAVIINRMLSPQSPNTLRGVLFQRNAFQPIRNGAFYNTPNESARRAALEALNGHDPTGGALFFFNPRQSTDRFMHSRPATTTIGQHRFTN